MMDRMKRGTDSSIKDANALISTIRTGVVLSLSPQDSCKSINKRTAGDTEPELTKLSSNTHGVD